MRRIIACIDASEVADPNQSPSTLDNTNVDKPMPMKLNARDERKTTLPPPSTIAMRSTMIPGTPSETSVSTTNAETGGGLIVMIT